MKPKIKSSKGCEAKLPIGGGLGNTIDNAVVIYNVKDYIDIENKYITNTLGEKWKKISQSLILDEKGFIEKIYVEYASNDEIVIYLNFYFDITYCI